MTQTEQEKVILQEEKQQNHVQQKIEYETKANLSDDGSRGAWEIGELLRDIRPAIGKQVNDIEQVSTTAYYFRDENDAQVVVQPLDNMMSTTHARQSGFPEFGFHTRYNLKVKSKGRIIHANDIAVVSREEMTGEILDTAQMKQRAMELAQKTGLRFQGVLDKNLVHCVVQDDYIGIKADVAIASFNPPTSPIKCMRTQIELEYLESIPRFDGLPSPTSEYDIADALANMTRRAYVAINFVRRRTRIEPTTQDKPSLFWS